MSRFALITLIGCLVAGVVFRQRLLAAMTQKYLVDAPAAIDTATHVMILSGDRQLESAAAMAAAGVTVLLPHGKDNRCVEIGADVSKYEKKRELLIGAGVPEARIERLPGISDHQYTLALCLWGWLERNPDAQVCVLVDALDAARVRNVITQRLSPDASQRVMYQSLEPVEYDVHRWWESRTGFKAFYRSSIAWLFTSPWQNVSPDPDQLSTPAFEAEFRQRLVDLGVPIKEHSDHRADKPPADKPRAGKRAGAANATTPSEALGSGALPVGGPS